MSRVIITVGVSHQRAFGPYLERFRRTFGEHGCADEIITWEDRWPPGSPAHHELHYGFKVYAIAEGHRRGHSSVLWCDCSCYAVKSIEPLWKMIETDGHYLAGTPTLDPETGFVVPHEDPNWSFDRLGEWSSDKSLDTFKLARDDAMKVTLLSGTCAGFDLRNSRSRAFIERLCGYAVPGHYNGTHSSGLLGRPASTEGAQMSLDPRCKGHRSDETYMTLIAREMKMTSSGEYFTGGNAERASTLIKSGYNL